VLLLAVALSSQSAGAYASPCTVDRAVGTTIDPQPFLQGCYGMRWNIATNRLLFMHPGPDGYYRLATMRPDGTDRREITSRMPGLPTRHQGSGYWHPSGKYFLCDIQKQEWTSPKLFGNPDYEALPGFGLHDDIWLIALDGSQAWKLTDEAGTRTQGILMPVFSPDGKKVAWADRRPDKKYVLKVAHFVESPQPHLEDLQDYAPAGPCYYETGSFSSDSKSLCYTSDQDTHSFWASQIYRLDLATGQSTRLTAGKEYNEHPTVVKTPTGDWVVYMSDRGNNRYPGHWTLGTDWWAVRLDGSGTKRLTFMNIKASNNPQSTGVPQVACTIAPSPDGTWFLGDVQNSLTKQTGYTRLVRFVGP
jgi:hypothetical protein